MYRLELLEGLVTCLFRHDARGTDMAVIGVSLRLHCEKGRMGAEPVSQPLNGGVKRTGMPECIDHDRIGLGRFNQRDDGILFEAVEVAGVDGLGGNDPKVRGSLLWEETSERRASTRGQALAVRDAGRFKVRNGL